MHLVKIQLNIFNIIYDKAGKNERKIKINHKIIVSNNTEHFYSVSQNMACILGRTYLKSWAEFIIKAKRLFLGIPVPPTNARMVSEL
jgi:hypothetical protein